VVSQVVDRSTRQKYDRKFGVINGSQCDLGYIKILYTVKIRHSTRLLFGFIGLMDKYTNGVVFRVFKNLLSAS